MLVESTAGEAFHAFDAAGYIRTQDGFVTSMQSTASPQCNDTECFTYLPIFNPADNRNQRSRLRIISREDVPVDVSVVGVDDQGLSPARPYASPWNPGRPER